MGSGDAWTNLRRHTGYQHAQITDNNPTPNSQLPTPFLRLCVSFLLFVLLISCATTPKAGQGLVDSAPDFSILPPGADLYLWADVGRAKPLLEAIAFADFTGKEASQILDRTESFMAAFYPEGDGRRFSLAGFGKYPYLRAGASMTFSSGWKKVKSETGNRYWHSEGYNLGVAMGSVLAIASDGDPFAPGAGSNPTPQAFEGFRRACVLSGWFTKPDVPLDRFMDSLGLPLQIPAEEFFLGVKMVTDKTQIAGNLSDGDLWELVFKFKTPSAASARSLLAPFSVARLFVQRAAIDDEGFPGGAFPLSPLEAAALLFANIPEQDEEYLTLYTGPLNADKIALLFNLFSVYLFSGN